MVFLGYVIAAVLLIFAILIIVYLFLDFIAHFLGAPFVPSSKKDIDEILKVAKLNKGQVFIEPGSGDGRVVISAVKNYGVIGIGVEVHPFLLFYSKLSAKLNKVSVQFKAENFFNTNYKKVDVIYLFLFPKTLKKLKEKFIKECRKNTLIISHGFKIEGFEKYLINTIERKVYNTYFYKL